MAKKLGKLPQHKKMAITGKPYKKGGMVKDTDNDGMKKGGMVKKKGCK